MISISCVVKQYISITPRNRVKIGGYGGDEISQTVTIISMEEGPLKIIDITSNIEDKIKYKLKTKKKGREYTLEIKNRSTKEDSFEGKIELKTNSEKKPQIVLYVSGMIREEIFVDPKSIYFGAIDTTKETFNASSLERTITLQDVRGVGLNIKKLKSSSNWIVPASKKEGRTYTIVVRLDKNKLPRGRFDEKIEIHTNYKKKSLTIEVKGEII